VTTVSSTAASEEVPRSLDPRRWRVLVLLCGLQFMILLDLTVVNVALPKIQEGLGFSASGLTWVVNAYVLAAGGLLILGGRLADVFGRRRLLLTGVVLFAVASAVSGAAVSPSMMVVGRFGQGAAEALAAPASLGLIALLFTDPKERTKALGIWAGIIGVGATLGYLIGGVLTDTTSWRWIFFINLPVALLVLLLIPEPVKIFKAGCLGICWINRLAGVVGFVDPHSGGQLGWFGVFTYEAFGVAKVGRRSGPSRGRPARQQRVHSGCRGGCGSRSRSADGRCCTRCRRHGRVGGRARPSRTGRGSRAGTSRS
jgi:MFS family permease